MRRAARDIENQCPKLRYLLLRASPASSQAFNSAQYPPLRRALYVLSPLCAEPLADCGHHIICRHRVCGVDRAARSYRVELAGFTRSLTSTMSDLPPKVDMNRAVGRNQER